VFGFKFRCVSEHDCKAENCQRYDSPSGQTARLYNARALAQGGDVALVCEGEFDTLIALSQLGVPAVGTPGTTWREHWSRCFSDFDRVVVIADHDAKPDGSDPGLKHAKNVKDKIPGAELALPPAGYDLGEWIAAEGSEVVREALGLVPVG
jgi:DNA primase